MHSCFPFLSAWRWSGGPPGCAHSSNLSEADIPPPSRSWRIVAHCSVQNGGEWIIAPPDSIERQLVVYLQSGPVGCRRDPRRRTERVLCESGRKVREAKQ